MPRGERAPEARGTIWYMGAKTRLLGPLDAAIRPLLERGARARGRPPALIDLFAGTGVVGAHFAALARVVAGDAQRYACVLTRSLLVPAPRVTARLPCVLREGARRAAALLAPHERAAALERHFLSGWAEGRPDIRGYRRYLEEEAEGHDPERELALGGGPILSSFRNVYFGVAQAALVDGLRAAIEEEREPERTALLSALLFAASRATSGTAHFAQPRGLEKPSEVRALLERRSVEIAALLRGRARFLERAGRGVLLPGRNEVKEGSYESLLGSLVPGEADVVYADPPYTQDHYSRFYHVLETLARGEAPALARDARGRLLRGRYPPLERRFRSGFCFPERVEEEFRRVTERAASLGAALVWSYSRTNGLLLREAGGRTEPLRDLLRERYRDVEIEEHPLRHSGAGDKNHAALEIIAVCRGPRGCGASRARRPRARAASV
jgi:16S rRNA G966 N2-methylase RsmD